MAPKKSVALTTIQRRGLDKLLPPEEAGAVYGTVNHHHGSEFERTHFQITQIRSSDVTGKKCIARKQSHGTAGLEQTQTNAIRRMTRRRDHLYIHRPHGESIAVFEVAVGKGSGRSLRKAPDRADSSAWPATKSACGGVRKMYRIA